MHHLARLPLKGRKSTLVGGDGSLE
jgi:hypothetical protein